MTITPYVDTDFTTIPFNSGIDEVKKALAFTDCLVVADAAGEPLGLLTWADLRRDARTAEDCDYYKPFVGPEEALLEVTGLMKHSGHAILPVQENGRLTGIIKSDDIVHPLAETVKKYQLLFQHVTHDLRNQIGNVSAICSLLDERLADAENRELLGYGQAACSSALDMLAELLNIEKKDNDNTGFRISNVTRFTTECIDQLKAVFIPKNIKVELSLTGTDFFARINAQHLQRLVHNILSNAVKFSEQGATIEVTSAISGDKFLLSIRDHGVGIPFEKQAYIFDRFTSAQRQGTSGEPSTGLGLYFSRQTVELHDGRIWFESEAGTGTTFFIELPGY